VLIVGVIDGVTLIVGVIDGVTVGVTLVGVTLGVTFAGIHSGQSFFLMNHLVLVSGPIPITLTICGSDAVFSKVNST